jgi:beta-glucosidase
VQKLILAFSTLVALAACGSENLNKDSAVTNSTATINFENWPKQDPIMVRDPAIEERVTDLLGRMTLEEKVGQIIQADIASVTPQQVREFNLGSILNGGGSAPGNDIRASADKWLALSDEFWDASTDTSDGGVGIPVIWGTDAVHGNSNIIGATIFPHNIGLGMADDPDMLYDIGRATAIEMLATGFDWTFAPTIAVARDDRWGRTYESYSEDPRIVAAYAPRIIEGIQGVYGSDDFLSENHMIATAKHFVGDGGTIDGRDQGDSRISESELREVHAAAYPSAINAGVQSVMASFNSFHGRKMHGYKEVLTDVLIGQMGFDGLVVGDWNGHGQVADCSNTSCAAAVNAGLDMFMAPNSWKRLYAATLSQVKRGEISMARLDEAVSRVIRVKLRAGVLESGRPSSRKHAGDFSLLGSDGHRAIARNAVRKSLVMLKNENNVLPISPDLNILLAGDGADNIGKQSGGWTLTWQGTGNSNDHFPHGMSIYDGFYEAMEAGGGTVTLSEDGSYTETPDIAIVVFGEDPYAEFQGDRQTVDYDSDDGLKLLKQYKDAGIPAVGILISGRPLWVNPEINASDAFVAAWLPGSEGGGIADVLVANAEGDARYEFTGKLSFSWPNAADQFAVNVGDEDYAPLFAYGHRLTYSDDGTLAQLSEVSGLEGLPTKPKEVLIEFGNAVDGRRLILRDSAGSTWVGGSRGKSAAGSVSILAADYNAQEDTSILTWNDAGSLEIHGGPVDFTHQFDSDMALELKYQVLNASAQRITVEMGNNQKSRSAVDVTDVILEQVGKGWQTALLQLSCFDVQALDVSSITQPFVLSSNGPMELQLESVRIADNRGDAKCVLN